MPQLPNHALPFRQAQGPELAGGQQTWPVRCGCHPRVPQPGSLSLGR